MTGIERLRQMAEDFKNVKTAEHCTFIVNTWRGRYIDDAIADIADQIEAEQDVETVRSDAMEAWEWVREHGGVEELRRMFQDADNRRVELCGALGIDLDKGWSEAMAAMRLRLMPEGCEWPRYEDGSPVLLGDATEDSVAVRRISFTSRGFYFNSSHRKGIKWYRYGERVKRPAVLAADGMPLEVGQTVWSVNDGREYKVVTVESPVQFDTTLIKVDDGKAACGVWIRPDNLTHQRPVMDVDGSRIEPAMDVWWVCEGDERGVHAEKLHVESVGDDGLVTCDPFNGGTWVELEPSELYVNRPVLDAGGVPIKVGDTVYDTSDGTELVITSTELDVLDHVKASQENPTKASVSIHPLRLTHAKSEPPDSWERIEEDAENVVKLFDSFDADASEDIREIVCRCKAMAERERGK